MQSSNTYTSTHIHRDTEPQRLQGKSHTGIEDLELIHTSFRKPRSSLWITDFLPLGPQGRVPPDPYDANMEANENKNTNKNKNKNKNDYMKRYHRQ